MVRKTLYVDGMTCSACESRIAKSLLAIEGVARARAQVNGGKTVVEYDDALASEPELRAAIEKVGYAVRENKSAGATAALGIGVVLSALYLLASSSGLFSALPKIDASIGYAMLFVVGSLTSIHCVAMCGGIALSQSVRPIETGSRAATVTKLQQLSPGLLYNAGRVFSYTAIGGIVGALGSVFNFSAITRGVIAGLAGLFMIILGLRMLGLIQGLPRMAKFIPAPLRATLSRLASGLRGRGPFAVGALNGLMPCGPLQTMQLYALGTGSALAGALSMFIFSMGTVPLMLVFGLSAALLPRRFVPVMVKASAVLVMFLGGVTFGRAASLSGIPLPDVSSLSFGAGGQSQVAFISSEGQSQAASIIPVADRRRSQTGLAATVKGGVQTITTDFKDGYYVPFTVQAGVPLKWTIRIKEEDLNGCNNPMEIPGYKIRKTLVPGDNLIEFTPAKEGAIPYNCWMGMIRSRITVVKDIAAAGPASVAEGGASVGDFLLRKSGGGACCGSSSSARN
jgi:sulfite exporter TauE/SafE/copper chaperone CopZ